MVFADWVQSNQQDWLTEHGKINHDKLNAEIDNETMQQCRKRMKSLWRMLMQQARAKPVFQN
jgi:hypothetical protein